MKTKMATTETTEVVGKQELIKRIAKQADVSQKQAGEIFDATLAAIKEALQAGEEVRLVGFGTFAVRESAERTGVNPRTREPMTIPAKERVRFSPGKELAEAVLKP
jgi:DNA-binding protein HU-beta